MKPFKPLHTLLFLLSVILLLCLVSLFFPKEGIVLSEGVVLKFPSLQSYLHPKEVKKVDISKLLAIDDSADVKTNSKDSITKAKEALMGAVNDANLKLITSIQYKDENKSALDNFFASLRDVKNQAQGIRILHYGDSQIEGDRITDYLRLKLQSEFGGSGPGLLEIVPVAQSVAFKHTYSSSWDRYQTFLSKDKRINHSNFGAAACLYRYAKPYVKGDTSTKKAEFKITVNGNGGAKLASYNKIKMFFGNSEYKTHYDFYENGTLKESDSLVEGGNFNIKTFKLSQAPNNFQIKFVGKDSPDFYGVSLEGDGGVMVDNFGLRGSSGTFFQRINSGQLSQFYSYLNVKLIILQFGGNSLPGIKDSTMAKNFGSYMQGQINIVKKLAPNASILVIGPSDMSVKDGEVYVTHPQLENLRNEIRKAAFNTNCAFFDMYDCMGGKNSMVSWVEAGIAANDYIHFSSGGARKIATLLYGALITDYNEYVKKH